MQAKTGPYGLGPDVVTNEATKAKNILPSDYDSYRGYELHRNNGSMLWWCECGTIPGWWTDLVSLRREVDKHIAKTGGGNG